MPTASVIRLRARLGGLTLAATRDPREYTAAARRQFRANFVDEVDPNRSLSEVERERRADAARRLFFARIALKSAQSRSERARRKKRRPCW